MSLREYNFIANNINQKPTIRTHHTTELPVNVIRYNVPYNPKNKAPLFRM